MKGLLLKDMYMTRKYCRICRWELLFHPLSDRLCQYDSGHAACL